MNGDKISVYLRSSPVKLRSEWETPPNTKEPHFLGMDEIALSG